LTFIFSNGAFFPMHLLGVGGHMRRIYDPTLYTWLDKMAPINQFISISAILLGFTQLIFLVNFSVSLFRGQVAGRNPWKSNTLEWSAPSPPPHGNFEVTPVVYRGPYEYSAPDAEEDYLPQTQLVPGQTGAVPVHHHH